VRLLCLSTIPDNEMATLLRPVSDRLHEAAGLDKKSPPGCSNRA
jgi:hypothetical protein